METEVEFADTRDHTRELFIRHHSRYEVSPYFVVLDVRTFGVPPSRRRIHSGFNLDLYGRGPDHGSALSFQNGGVWAALNEICAAWRAVGKPGGGFAPLLMIPFPGRLLLKVESHCLPH